MNNNNNNNKRKILHLLTWEWSNIQRNLQIIKDTGFTAIQISPIQQCKKLWDDNGRITKGTIDYYTVINREWWKLYQPLSFEIGNFLGTKEDFISLCNACKQIGIEVYVDVILRHVANRDNSKLEPHENVDKELVKYLKTTQHDTMNYHDRWELINHCTGLPMFDYNNIEFQNKHVIPFLMEILKYADGIRFDQLCKHYALPSEGGSIFENVIAKLPRDKYYYGEGIEIPSDIFDEYAKYVDVLCPYHENWGKCNNSVRFCESHDTCLSFLYSLSMNDSARLQGYEDCLRQYNNVIYFARRNDNTIFSDKMKEINNRY